MDQTPISSLSDLERECDPEKKATELLDTRIDPSEFVVLGGYFETVDSCINSMGLQPAEKGNVKFKFASQGVQSAMMECFKNWRNHNPAGATYRTLLEIVLKAKEKEAAIQIYQHMIDIWNTSF